MVMTRPPHWHQPINGASLAGCLEPQKALVCPHPGREGLLVSTAHSPDNPTEQLLIWHAIQIMAKEL
ncbi:hypothetical protein D9M68_929890 [compost metagenome]